MDQTSLFTGLTGLAKTAGSLTGGPAYSSTGPVTFAPVSIGAKTPATYMAYAAAAAVAVLALVLFLNRK